MLDRSEVGEEVVGNDKFGEVSCTAMRKVLVTWQLGGEKPPDGEDAPSSWVGAHNSQFVSAITPACGVLTATMGTRV